MACCSVCAGGLRGGRAWGQCLQGLRTCSRGLGGRYLGAVGSLGLVLCAGPHVHPTLLVHRS